MFALLAFHSLPAVTKENSILLLQDIAGCPHTDKVIKGSALRQSPAVHPLLAPLLQCPISLVTGAGDHPQRIHLTKVVLIVDGVLGLWPLDGSDLAGASLQSTVVLVSFGLPAQPILTPVLLSFILRELVKPVLV